MGNFWKFGSIARRSLRTGLCAVLCIAALFMEMPAGQIYGQTTVAYNGMEIIHNSRYDGYTISNGIDVSAHNGEIDWAKVRAAGIDFAIIRVAFRGYENGALSTDKRAIENIEGALKQGIKVGVYIFSQALNEQEASEEARYVLNLISKYQIELPIVMDYEYVSGTNGLKGRLYRAQLSVEQATSAVNAFCRTVTDSGYIAMLYANKNMLEEDLNMNGFEYKVWLANYMDNKDIKRTEYQGDYSFWQYTPTGRVDGIGGNVDLNFWYVDESAGSIFNEPLGEPISNGPNGEIFYQNESGDLYCTDKDGNIIRNQFIFDGAYTYYFQQDGTAMRDRLTYHPDGEHVIYFDSNGHEVFDNFAYVKQNIEGNPVDDMCYFDTFGYMYVDVMTYDAAGTNLYYVNPYGVIERNRWFGFSDGGIGYANADGTLMTSQFTYDQWNRVVYMQGNGHVAKGLIYDGVYYYHMDETDGHLIGTFQ